MGRFLAERFEAFGGRPRFHPATDFGNNLQIDFPERREKHKPVLLLGHFDTVYPLGTLADHALPRKPTDACTAPACST